MSQLREWPRIAVVGAGAVGGYFGGMFARAGAQTVFVGRRHFADALNSRGLVLDKSQGLERIRARATTEMSAVRDCSLILFCVKANDTQDTANQMAPFLRPDATVVCLQNGVDNADQVRAAANVIVLPAAVYVAVSMPEPGRVKHLARGDLIIFRENNRSGESLHQRSYTVPDLRQHRRRTMGEASVQLRVECDLRVRTCTVR